MRSVWFVCIGLWLGALMTLAAYALVWSIIGLPIGLMRLNRLPKMMTLRATPLQTNVVTMKLELQM